MEDKLKEEFKRFRREETEEEGSNPMQWWQEKEVQYPLLGRFWGSYADFQATSVASERIFNRDTLLYHPRRQNLGAERSEECMVL